MMKDFFMEHQSAVFSMALTVLLLVVRVFFWQMEMLELRTQRHSENPKRKKQKQTYKRTDFADAA